jgi:hypothetical protein
MAYNIPDSKDSLLASTQASCLPDMVWTYEPTSAAFTQSRLMYRCFRAWNFANKHGFKLGGVLHEGNHMSVGELARLNLWIQGGGAMAAQNMEHWEAVRLLERIIRIS